LGLPTLVPEGPVNKGVEGPRAETPLVFAAKNKNPDIVKLLLQAGASRGVETALMVALENKNPDIVKLLLQAGASLGSSLKQAIEDNNLKGNNLANRR
jgi:ankyrin repeat protein